MRIMRIMCVLFREEFSHMTRDVEKESLLIEVYVESIYRFLFSIRTESRNEMQTLDRPVELRRTRHFHCFRIYRDE